MGHPEDAAIIDTIHHAPRLRPICPLPAAVVRALELASQALENNVDPDAETIYALEMVRNVLADMA